MKRLSITILLCIVLIAGLAIPVLANVVGTQRELTVTYRDIHITLDGTTIIPRNERGEIVEPFLYDGTVYLPFRAIAEALGLNISWDAATSTVRIRDQELTPLELGELGYIPTPSDLRPAEEMEPVESDIALMTNFPHSTELPEGVRSIRLTHHQYAVNVLPDVVFDTIDGVDLRLQILLPMPTVQGAPLPTDLPLIVFIPGSAWLDQGGQLYRFMADLVQFARAGFAVAVAEYRHSGIAPFPAQVEDAKTAIRFMRMNAEEFRIDPDRIAVWGNSSGGHTAILAGITEDGVFDNGTFDDYSAQVNAIVNWFSPTCLVLSNFYPNAFDWNEGFFVTPFIDVDSVLGNVEEAERASIMPMITDDLNAPPMLIMHGSRDPIVHFNQSVRLYEALVAANQPVEMWKIEDADHDGNGWFSTPEAVGLVMEFLNRKIG